MKRAETKPLNTSPFVRFSGLFLLAGLISVAPVCFAASSAAGPQVEIRGDSGTSTSPRPVSGAPPESASLLQQERHGADFRYVVHNLPSITPLEIELGFAEISMEKPGVRVFSVDINGKRAIESVDLIAATGGMNRAYIRRFTITPRHGTLDIHFRGEVGNAKIGYVRVKGAGREIVIGPGASDLAAAAPRAEGNPATGEVFMDGTRRTWQSGVPFGGIGTGKFEILPDGSFANSTINNSWDNPVPQARGSFFAVFAKARSGGGMARILKVPGQTGSAGGFDNAKTVAGCTYRGLFPFAEWRFRDPDMPISVTLKGFSPLVPGNTRDSSLPVGFLVAEVENPNGFPVSAAVALSWEDVNGRGGSRRPADAFGMASPVARNDAGTNGIVGIHFTSLEPATGRRSTFLGDSFVGVETSRLAVTRVLHWNPGSGTIPWWKQFERSGRLDRRNEGAATWSSTQQEPGGTAAVISAACNLAPRERREVTFLVAWFAPRIVTEWNGTPRTEYQDYSTSFASSVGVAAYAAGNHARLLAETRSWHDAVMGSNLPDWLKVSLVNSAYTMVSNSILFAGRKHSMLETSGDGTGVLGAMDQRMASHAFVAMMFPDLDRFELNLFGSLQQPDGQIPRYCGNIHDAFGIPGFGGNITDSPDLTCSYVLQVLKAYRWSADRALLEGSYPHILRGMKYLEAADKDGDFVPEGGSTFGAQGEAEGAFVYTATSYLAALRAAEAAARAMGDPDSAAGFARRFRNAQSNVLRGLWRSDHMVKAYNPASTLETSSSFSGALAGDWFARLAALPPVLPDDLAATAVRSLVQRHLYPFSPVPPLEISPFGKILSPATPVLQLEPYLGVAALYRGFPDAGFEFLKRVHELAFSVNRNPWALGLTFEAPSGKPLGPRNCMASMAAWNILPAVAGFSLDLPAETLFFNPAIPLEMGDELHIPIFTPRFHAWIDYDHTARSGTLTITRTFPAGGGHPVIRHIVNRVAEDGSLVGTKTLRTPFVVREGAVLTIGDKLPAATIDLFELE